MKRCPANETMGRFDFCARFWLTERLLMTASTGRRVFRASSTSGAGVSNSLLLGLLLTGVGISLPTRTG